MRVRVESLSVKKGNTTAGGTVLFAGEGGRTWGRKLYSSGIMQNTILLRSFSADLHKSAPILLQMQTIAPARVARAVVALPSFCATAVHSQLTLFCSFVAMLTLFASSLLFDSFLINTILILEPPRPSPACFAWNGILV